MYVCMYIMVKINHTGEGKQQQTYSKVVNVIHKMVGRDEKKKMKNWSIIT